MIAALIETIRSQKSDKVLNHRLVFRYRVPLYLLLCFLFFANPAKAETNEYCTQALDALESNSVAASRELLRKYIVQSYQSGEQDSRCGQKFVTQLRNAWSYQLNQEFGYICQQSIEKVNLSKIVALDLIESRLLALGYSLNPTNIACQKQVEQINSGQFWLQKQSPELADILKNCHTAKDILDTNMSKIRLSQARSMIRAAELGLLLEKETARPPHLSDWVNRLYKFRVSEAELCIEQIRISFELFTNESQ